MVQDLADLQSKLKAAGSNLVVMEVQSETVCEDVVGVPQAVAAAKCANIKHTFQRVARECSDATFLMHNASDTPESKAILGALGVDVLPTLQFWRNGKMLWEHRGASGAESDLAEGVLYYEGQDVDGSKAKELAEIESRSDFTTFVSGNGKENVLQVVQMANSTGAQCIHVFAATLALSKNLKGFAAFGRVLCDSNSELTALQQELKVSEVPTFLFYRSGAEVGRLTTSSRADLIGRILEIQAVAGVRPPMPSLPRKQKL